MDTIKLCSDAISAIPTKLCLVTMWEDNALDEYEGARDQAEWIIEQGGSFLLIEQYNNVNAVCGNARDGHWDCWHYDPSYALYLVPRTIWQTCYADVTGIHAEHQHKYSQCKADPNYDDAAEQERRRRDEEIPF